MTGEIRRMRKIRKLEKIGKIGKIAEMAVVENAGDRGMICEAQNEFVAGVDNFDDGAGIVSENCNCSVYTMASVAGCILLCIGIVIYALIGA